MARTKTIKEVEVKFSPAFDKAINGVKTKKKAATKKAKTKKAVTKTKTKATKTRKAKATKPAAPKAKRGYTIVRVERELTINRVKDLYELYELTGKGLEQPKYFVTEEHAKRYIETLKSEDLQSKALAGKVHGGPMARAVVSEMKELAAQADLPELDTERPERCDKTSIEDIDA
jgi:hypothetical protein